jgi:enoyl-CoA hydratase
MSDMDVVLMEKRGKIALISFNRPQLMNALNKRVNSRLIEILDAADRDTEVGVVVITGAGDKAFVAGGDIKEMQELDPLGARRYALVAKDAVDKIYHFSKPVIAAINGFCLGGGLEYALACDIRLCSENARFGLPEINLGIMPGSSGTQRLARVIGMGKAKEFMYTGEQFNAQQAFEMGLVNNVYQQNKLLEEALNLAEKIATKSSTALGFIKSAIQIGAETDLKTGFLFEIDCFALCFSTTEQKAAFAAFVEKNNKNKKEIQG